MARTVALTRVAIVAGEASGDILGAGLIAALKRDFPNCIFEGVGGDLMIAEGFTSHYAMDRLAVMGLIDPLKRLPELLRMRRDIIERYRDNPPDVFIGIDAPDFNLTIEKKLREAGVATCHYVSPSVWAWRQGRIKKIKKAVNLMLTLFPFEAAFYEKHNIPVHFVGHPLADKFPLECDQSAARSALGLEPSAQYIALLPGSRKSEVEKLTPLFVQAALRCFQKDQRLKFLIPAANQARYEEIEQVLQTLEDIPVDLILGRSHEVMAASDAIVMASGTTTLEAMLLKKPMVIAYRMAALSFWLIKRMVKVKFVGLPNLLANRSLVPELLQDDATPENLSDALMRYIENSSYREALIDDYVSIHKSIRKNANQEAAEAIKKLCL